MSIRDVRHESGEELERIEGEEVAPVAGMNLRGAVGDPRPLAGLFDLEPLERHGAARDVLGNGLERRAICANRSRG